MIGLTIYQEERPWGNFRQFTHNSNSTVKILTIKPNEAFSLQYHQTRTEFWKVLAGGGLAEIGEKKLEAKVGNEYEVPPGEKHRISAGPEGISILEISTGVFDEKDIVRLEDKYGRAQN